MGETFTNMVGCVRALADVDGFLLLHQRIDDFFEMAALVRKVGADHVLARGADGEAVSRIIVRAVGEALPSRDGLSVALLAAIVFNRAAARDVFDEIDEAPHELLVVVREAGREVEVAVRLDGADRAGGDAELARDAGIEVERLRANLKVLADEHGP